MSKKSGQGRQQDRETPQEEADLRDDVKYSVIVPARTNDKVDAILKARGISLSAFIRKVFEDHLEDYLQESLGLPVKGARRPGGMTIHMTEATRELLLETASLWNLDPASMCQVCLGQHLHDLHRQGLETQAANAKALTAMRKAAAQDTPE